MMKIILFDMDDTLVSADTGDLWHAFLENKGIVDQQDQKMRLKFNQDYRDGVLDAAQNFRFESFLINKIPVQYRTLWRDEFFERCVKSKISPAGLKLISEYKENKNNTVILITATLSFIALPVAQYANMDDLIATEVEKKGEVYTGKLSGIACLREGKLERFKLWLQEKKIIPSHTCLYSDSINDLPLLEFVTQPVVVDPDPGLKNIALERNWEIISLK